MFENIGNVLPENYPEFSKNIEGQQQPPSPNIDEQSEEVSQSPTTRSRSISPDSLEAKKDMLHLEALAKTLDQMRADEQGAKELNQITQTMVGIRGGAKVVTDVSKAFEAVDKLPLPTDLVHDLTKLDLGLVPVVGLAGHTMAEADFILQLVFLIPRAKKWKELGAEVAKKEESLAGESDPHRQMELKREIEEAKGKQVDLLMSTSGNLALTGCLVGADALQTGSYITAGLSQASRVAAGLAAGAQVLGVAASGVTGVISAVDLTKGSLELAATEDEAGRLVALLKSERLLDPLVVEVIELRLQHLEQLADDDSAKIAKSAVLLYSAGLGGGAAIIGTGLGLAGVTIGATALSATGVGAAAVCASVIVGGLSYAAVKNRKAIALTFQEASLALRSKLAESRRFKSEKIHEVSANLLLAVEERLQELGRASARRDKLVVKLQEEEALVNELYNVISDPESMGGVNQQAYLRAHLISGFERINVLRKLIREVPENTTQEIQRELQKLEALVDNINRAQIAMESASQELTGLREHKERVVEEKQIIALSKQFAHLDPNGVRAVGVALQRSLHQNPESLKEVKSFLQQEGYVDSKFDDDPLKSIFSYLIQQPRRKDK